MVMLMMSPGPSKSVGCGGGGAVRFDIARPGGGGKLAAFVTSTSLNGYSLGLVAACLISEVVGPLDGRLAQPASRVAASTMSTVPRSAFRRRGKGDDIMNERTLGI